GADHVYVEISPAVEHPMGSGDTLYVGQGLDMLTSQDGRFRFVHNPDGNVVLYDLADHVLWKADTHTGSCIGTGQVYLTAGGLVVANENQNHCRDYPNPLSAPDAGASLIVQNDRNVVIYAGGTDIW